MSSASRSALITACSVSLSLLVTRSWSPWMRICTFGLTFWIRFRRSRAMSSVMPAFRATSIWPRPRPMDFGSPALKSFADSWRRAAFSLSTWRAALARSSLADSTTITFSWRSKLVWVSLKSYLVATSRRAWSRALVSSAGSNSEMTSNEYSDTGGAQDRLDPGGALVEGLLRRAVVRVGAEVQVVRTFLAGPFGELLQDGLASRRNRP